jgi:3',5'-cyclic AMP phosphodiesterase CpdA
MVLVAQISDTHLSPGKRHFASNWEPLLAWVHSHRPDLVIHTGDVTVDGADVEDDMVFCASILRGLQAPVLCVPGNHDVGEARHPFQPVNSDRIARWRRHFGADYWAHDSDGWRFIGLNSLVLASGDPEEERQFAWLERTLEEAAGNRIAWFMHQPLFLAEPDEGDTGYWGVKPEPRKRLLDLIDRYKVSLVASGHVHKANDRQLAGTRFIWGPSSGFIVGPALQPDMAGDKHLGAVIYTFDRSGFSATISHVDGLETFCIDDVVHEVYPPRQAA